MATTILDEWTGYGLANGEHLDYSKAIAGALHGLDPAKVPVGEQVTALFDGKAASSIMFG